MRKHALVSLFMLAGGGILALGAGAEEENAKGRVRPNLAYYQARVAPIVERACAECHADPERILGEHRLRPPPGRPATDKHHQKNFRTILKLIQPGVPEASRWLLKPLGPRQGGVEHGGGVRIRRGSPACQTMVAFINGATRGGRSTQGAAARSRKRRTIGREGVQWQAERLSLAGGATVETDDDPACEAGRFVRPGPSGGSVEAPFRTAADATWRITFRVRGPGEEIRWRVDDLPTRTLPRLAAGYSVMGTTVVLDGDRPLRAPQGRLEVKGGTLRLEGEHQSPSSFLLPADPHAGRVEADLVLPAQAGQADDAFLLFGMQGPAHGAFLGLADGGRQVVMGTIEAGLHRVRTSAKAPPAAPGSARRLRVEPLEGVVVGSVDGEALAFLHHGLTPGAGRSGILTHGRVVVWAMRLDSGPGRKMHEAAFRRAPAIVLPAGDHVLRVEMGPEAPGLDSVTVEPLK